MTDDIEIMEELPPQGFRTPSGRQGAVAVPGSSLSSSNDGLPTVCPAGAVEEQTSAKTSSRKRSSALEGRTKSSKRRELLKVEEGKVDDVSSVEGDRGNDSLRPWCWDDIDDSEMAFFAENNKELYELTIRRETFKSKVSERSTKALIKLTGTLIKYCRTNLKEIQALQPDGEDLLEPNERSDQGQTTALITFQTNRLCLMAQELERRLWKTEKDLEARELEVEALRKENERLRKSSGKNTTERNSLMSKGPQGTNARDTGVSMETEVPEVDMEEAQALSPSHGVSKSVMGAIEATIEKKMGELFSRLGLTSGGGQEGTTLRPWSEVVKGGRKPPTQRDQPPSRDGVRAETRGPVTMVTAERPNPGGKRRRVRQKKDWPIPPKTAAVVLTAAEGRGEDTCGEFLRRAREEIPIEELEVPLLEVKRSRAGGYILGVPGQQSEEKANLLAGKLSSLAEDMGVKISRPIKKADIRVSGMDESMTPNDVVEAIVKLAGCRASDIKSGRVQRSFTGMGSLWMQCPVEAALKVAKNGKLKVGWAGVSVEILKARPIRCFRCLEVGHMGVRCTSTVTRAHLCYRCGTPGHRSGECRAEVLRCPVCADTNRPHNHALGGQGCVNVPPARNIPGGNEQTNAQDGRAVSSSAG